MDTDVDQMLSNLSAELCAESQDMTTPTSQKLKRKRPHVTTVWTTENVITLINIIESYPCLWEYSSAEYKDRQKRENAWRDVAAKIPGRDVDECKAKWANVKTAYNNCKKKMVTKSGQGSSSLKPHWSFWTAMQFYHNHDREKTTTSVSTIDIDSPRPSEPFSSHSSSPAPAATPASTSSPEHLLQDAIKLLDCDKEDKWHNVGMYLASQLRELEQKNKQLAHKLHITLIKTTMDALSQMEDN